MTTAIERAREDYQQAYIAWSRAEGLRLAGMTEEDDVVAFERANIRRRRLERAAERLALAQSGASLTERACLRAAHNVQELEEARERGLKRWGECELWDEALGHARWSLGQVQARREILELERRSLEA